MNMHPILGQQKLRSAARVMTKLKAWRKAQLVAEPGQGSREMRLTDVPGAYGIPWQTWHAWEQPIGHKDFKRPNAENMAKLAEITGGAITPADFYAIEAASGGG